MHWALIWSYLIRTTRSRRGEGESPHRASPFSLTGERCSSLFSVQSSVLSFQSSVFSFKLSVFSVYSLVFSLEFSVFSFQCSILSFQFSVFSPQSSVLKKYNWSHILGLNEVEGFSYLSNYSNLQVVSNHATPYSPKYTKFQTASNW